MTLQKAIEVLNTYQSWRIGEEDVDMQKPSVVTEAINTLLDYHIGDVNEMIEISDEEIKQKAYSLSYKDLIISIKCFIKGCEWYRDQLKQKS